MTFAPHHNRWLHRFALLTALATLALIVVGGLVTSHGAGMAVPDWPNSYGYNMFLFPVSRWIGGILYEHTHRLVATFVGVLVVALTRWLGGSSSRRSLIGIGLAEILGGIALLQLAPDWKGAGHFLSGIGGVVLLAGLVWFKHEPAPRPLPQLGWLAFATVQVQGLLGGLRVVLYKNELGIFHATLAQLFFVLLCAIALLTSRWWRTQQWISLPSKFNPNLRWCILLTTFLILGQLVLGATMRHQHAGLAIPDFPLAYGKLWPAMDPASIEAYNQQRMEIVSANAITASQIGLQMAHRLLAVLILAGVVLCAFIAKGSALNKMGYAWLTFVLGQALLGATTIWSNKAADVATAHVLVGALCLAVGGLFSLVSFRRLASARCSAKDTVADLSFEPSRTSG